MIGVVQRAFLLMQGRNGIGNKVHIHDLQATIMQQLGFEHEKLTYRFQGRDYRLTDVHGHVVLVEDVHREALAQEHDERVARPDRQSVADGELGELGDITWYPDRTWHGQKFSDEVHFVCPWHGYEYDIKTGECAADRRLRLKKYNVVRRGDDIFVTI